MIHAQFGRDVSGAVIAVENGTAGAGFLKSEVGMFIGAPFADAFRIVLNPDGPVRVNAACVRMNQNVGDDAGMFQIQAR
ncbi:hypothetical protein D3C79_1043310 [compost metagenome]